MPIARKSISVANSGKSLLSPPSVNIKKWVLDVPFEWRAWASQQKVKWNDEHRVSIYTGDTLPEGLKPFEAKIYSWEWLKQQIINNTWEKPERPKVMWEPRPHQKVAAEAITRAWNNNYPGFLLADDVGLGKTISAWSFVLSQSWIKRILIVSPVAVLAHWRNTVIHVGDGDKQLLIINYDRLGKIFEASGVKLSSNRAKGKQKRLAKQAPAPEFDLIIWDESHKCKNPQAARTQMSVKLNEKAKFVMWLSATAGQTPLEMSYLAPILAKSTGSKVSTMKDFEEWCKAQGLGVKRGAFGKWEWVRSDDDVARIKSWLFDGKAPPAIRRRPEEISGWRELERQLYPLDLTAEEVLAYSEAWHIFQQEEMGLRKNTKASIKDNKAQALVNRLRLRQKSSWLRIDSTLDLSKEFLENGKQVAISVGFRDTQEELAKKIRGWGLDPALIHGSQSNNEKESERLRFQTGETPIIIFTVEEGVSLHQGEHNDVPRVLLVHDLRWSAIQMAQIEGRCHRDGKFAPSLWLYAAGTIDEKIAEVLVSRVKSMKDMMGDDTATLAAIEALLKKESHVE